MRIPPNERTTRIVPEPSSLPFLDLTPQIDALWDELQATINRVLRSGQFVMGPDVLAFEEEVADFLGVRHAIGVNSGTDALIIGLRALGVGPGDEVITTPFSFFATAESISNVGATPVFVDVDESTFNIDPTKIEVAITERTAAIMPVHLYGRPAPMEEIQAIAERHGLEIIEDCAQSFGARYKGRQTGSLGRIGAFSFFPTKNLGAFGDGGLITTNDDELAKLARMLREHGSQKRYHNEILGYNSRLDSLQAAVLRIKLPYINRWNEKRREAAQRYSELLAELPGVITPALADGHVFHQYTIRLLEADRNTVQQQLAARGVSTMVYYPVPQDRLPVYLGRYTRNPISEMLAAQVLSLPIWPELSPATQQWVAQEVAQAVRAT